MNPANTYPAETHRLPNGKLWYGFAAPAFAWAAHGATSVFLSTVYCPSGIPHWGRLGEGGVRLAIGLVTIGLLAVAISAGVVSYRLWRSLRARRREEEEQQLRYERDLIADEGRTREDFMALGGVLVSIVCSVGILYAGIPLIILNVCMRAR
jgi:hypothetical protein